MLPTEGATKATISDPVARWYVVAIFRKEVQKMVGTKSIRAKMYIATKRVTVGVKDTLARISNRDTMPRAQI